MIAWSPSTNGTFDYGNVNVGQTASQEFTLTNSGGSATGMLSISLMDSEAFAITSDACTGTALGPRKSCTVTVEYAPTMAGSKNATLTARGRRSATDPASITLTGTGVAAGAPDLTLSPGTYIGGTTPKNYDYANGFGNWSTTFTVTNNGTGTSETLQLAGCCNPQFTLSNDTCTGASLAPNGSCTFDLTFTAPGGCNPGDEFHTPLNIIGIPSGDYIFLVAHGFCPF
jgi:hypothetical protein